MAISVTHKSDVPLWKTPEFHSRCCELAMELQALLGSVQLGSISMRFHTDPLPNDHGKQQLKAEVAWQNEVFATLLCPLDPLAQTLGNVYVFRGNRGTLCAEREREAGGGQDRALALLIRFLRDHAEEIVAREGKRVSTAQALLSLLR